MALKTLDHPFNVMRHARWDTATRMPQVVVPAIATALGGGTIATIAAYAIYYVGTTAITSAIMRKLAPDMSGAAMAEANKGTIINAREAAAPQEYVYGQVRKGGIVTFMETSGDDNKYMHIIIAVAGHEVEEIGQVYINEEVAGIDSNGNVVDSRWNNKIKVYKHLGNQTSATDNFANAPTNLAATLHAETSATSTFVGKGIAYMYVRLEFDQDTFAGGIPTFTAVVKGKKVFDPRTSTTDYSNNAALCIRDYIVSSYGLDDPAIDETYFAAAANDCDESVATAGGGTQKRYTIDGVINASSTTGVALADMLDACNGTLFPGGGVYKLKVGVYNTSVKSLTLDDFRSGITLPTRLSRRDNFNRVTGKFVYGGVYDEINNPNAGDWVETDFPAIESATFLSEDNGIENSMDISLLMVTDSARAQRIAKQKLYRSREQLTISAEFGLGAMGVEVGDTIDLTIDKYGWTNKEFEVATWRMFIADTGGIRVAMTLRETSSAAFDWNGEETDIITNNTTLPTYYSTAAISGLALTATSVVNDDGITIPAIMATWNVSNDAFVQYYEIQYKRLGGEEDYGLISDANDEQEDWGSITVAYTSEEDYGLTNEPILSPDADYVSSFGSTTSFLIQPVLNGYEYNVRVRSVTSLGVRSPWASATLASTGDTTPPNAPLALSAVGTYKAITLSWINPGDQDLAYVEIWQNTTNNLSTATLVGSVAGTSFTVPNLPNNTTRYYWARAVDYSLNKSEYTTVASATTLLIEPNDFSDAVNDLFQEAGAFGIEPVSSLPASGAFDGQLVLLLPDITIYRWDSATSSWSDELYTASSVEVGSITYAAFATGIEPVGVVDALPTVTGYEGPQVVILTTDGKLYRLVSGAWTAAINTDDIEGTIGENLFSDDLRPIERVAALPSTGLTQGRVVLLTTDNKLYRYTGNAWTSAVPATDVTGQITGTQIADNSITTSKIAANQVTANEIAANAVTATQISAGSVTADKVAAGAISADKIAANAVNATKIAADAVTADKIAANAVDANAIQANAITAGKIAAGAVSADQIAANAVVSSKIFSGAVTTDKLAVGVVTADKIASGAIITSKIAAGAVTANKISVSELSAISADLGTILVDTANIANGSISNAKIGDLQVDTIKIANAAVTSTASSTFGSTAVSFGTWTTLATVNLSTDGNYDCLINISAMATAGGGGPLMRMVYEGTPSYEWGFGSIGGNLNMSNVFLRVSDVGTTTVSIQGTNSSVNGSVVFQTGALIVTEIRR